MIFHTPKSQNSQIYNILLEQRIIRGILLNRILLFQCTFVHFEYVLPGHVSNEPHAR